MKLIAILTGFLLAISSASTMADKEIKTEDFSGWMENYDSLTYDEKRNAFRFFNEEKRGTYQKVMLHSVIVYGRDAKSEAEIATQATDYMAAGVSSLLESRDLLATEAGEGVVRASIAITGVEKSKEELKAYNFVPVAAVFRGAQAATGNVATYIDTRFEAEMVDSVTGEQVAAVVAKGIEETEKRSGDSLRFDDIKPTLDKWLAQYAETPDEYLARR